MATTGAPIDKSGTITAGGTAQVLSAARNRRYLSIQNLSTGVLWFSDVGTAAATQPSMALKACAVAGDGTGGAMVWEAGFIPSTQISIFGATTGQAFAAREF